MEPENKEPIKASLSDPVSLVKLAIQIIERIGFPVVVSIFFGYLLMKMIPENTQILKQVELLIKEKTDRAGSDHQEMLRKLDQIRDRLK